MPQEAPAPEAAAPRARARRPLAWPLLVPLAVLGAGAASLLVVALAYLLRTLHDLVVDNYRSMTYIGINPPKALAIAAVALVLLVALPLAILEGVSSLRWRRAEREAREARPHDAVTPYQGPEGRGLLFEGPRGRLLLLRPPGGIGKPRALELPLAPSAENPPSPAAASGG